MKIIYFIVIILFMMRNSSCFRAMNFPSMKLRSDPLTNFIQLANKKISTSNKKKSENSEFKYSVKISVIKQTDAKDDQPLEFNSKLSLTKNSIDIYENGMIKKQITYLE